MFSLKGKSVYVAGACGLIGRAICPALAQHGAKVITIDIIDNPKPDIRLDISGFDFLQFFDNRVCDVWINCTYPKDAIEHFRAYLNPTIDAATAMQKNGGSIINFSSIYGVVGANYSLYVDERITMPIWYAACKGAIISLTRAVATKYGQYNIRANCISPGGMYNGHSAEFYQKYSCSTPIARMGKVDDLIGAVLYLASDASKYVTGQNLVIDGGRTAW